MGLKRFVKHVIWPSTYIGDTIKNIADEGALLDGIKKTVKETYSEDNPITSAVYKSGKYDGKKEGYSIASDEYEEKLLSLADEFIKQKNIFEKERNAYEALLDEYTVKIDILVENTNRTELENEYLQQLLLRERKLRLMVE